MVTIFRIISKFRTGLLVLTAVSFLSQGCTRMSQKRDASVKVEWELIHNFSIESEYALAAFSIENKSQTVMGPSNWVLFFNMAPRNLVAAGDTNLADVMHINGDWYKIVPRNNFILKSGEKQTIYYEFHECALKETDAPCGLYIVFYDEKGQEDEIIPLSNYSILPFVREEQILCSKNDHKDTPTAETLYNKYQKLNAADGIELQPIIPSPRLAKKSGNTFLLDKSWILSFDAGLETEADFLQTRLSDIAGLDLKADNKTPKSFIRLSIKDDTEEGDSPEAYLLSLRDSLILIEGSKTGVFYGIQTLLRMIPFDVYQDKPGKIEFQETYIEDSPRFAYRGQHIDVCRNFQTKEQILKIIDLMAMYKLNRLHLYLTEDEAWRLQINALPELTEIGSHRGHPSNETDYLPPAYGSGPFSLSDQNFGTGYYTREDFKDIIRYAHDRHIMVIPSINFPGHARAAIMAMEVRYKRLSAENREDEANEFRLIDPYDHSVYRSAQFYNDNVVSVARESVYHFFETVIDDVLAMYSEAEVPIDMIHTGGDEVPEGAWTSSPMCDSLLAELPYIDDPKNLQKYFFSRILEILSERNLKAGGWEEVVLTKDANRQYEINPEFNNKSVIPYIWNNLAGSEDLGYRIANAGYPIVLCPVTNFYFDLAYSNDPQEPGLYWGGNNEERDAWEFAPNTMFINSNNSVQENSFAMPENFSHLESLRPDSRQNILGLQAQLWHETIQGSEMMEYYLLPKIIAFAERCWAAPPKWESMKNPLERSVQLNAEWRSFSYTLYTEELPILSFINGGYNYRIPPAGAIIEQGYVKANAISSELIIRYTTDGSEPDDNSPVYTSPFEAKGIIKLKVFDRAGRSGRTSNIY